MEEQNRLSPPQKSIDTHSFCSQFQLECSEFENISEAYALNYQNINKSPKKKSGRNAQKGQNSRIWSSEDQSQFISLHKKIGNKWTLLSQQYPGTSQNFIKNHFYSRLRKSIRKLNKIISMLYQKKHNKFKLNIIFKLSNISEGKIIEKQKISPRIFTFYRDLLYRLIQFSQSQIVEGKCPSLTHSQSVQIQSFILALIALQNLFRLVRGQRTVKGKKKNIAYLRQFSFKLGPQNHNQMVITKQNIYIYDYQHFELLPQFLHSITCQTQPEKLHPKKKTPESTFCSGENLNYQKTADEVLNLKQHILQLQKDNQSENCSQIWRDYFGLQMKQYDILNVNQEIPETLNQLQSYSFNNNFDFSQDHNM